ncbi:hypothetical protein LCGC14_1227310 [marine sediment metagenome]|uniref:Uncharacterized protein n=1 Tax=marine sediment metagenome TaxID=412755 RepID=A0A0F9LWP0_9ZZZZ
MHDESCNASSRNSQSLLRLGSPAASITFITANVKLNILLL